MPSTVPSTVVRKPERNPETTAQMPASLPDDGTRQLLLTGVWTLAAGVAATLLTKFVFGGIGPQGPHTNSGWLALIAAMMCLPFGSMVTLLGVAKWLRKRRLYRQD